MEDERLTIEDYEIAKKNGISKELAYSRFANYGWEKERAIKQPKHQNNPVWQEWKETAAANGIYRELFYSRMRKGMTAEQAATKLHKFRKSKG